MLVPVTLGAATLLYSLLTDYEYSVFNIIPFNLHLGIDFLSGLFLAASPWIFGFGSEIFLPHLFFGIFEMAVVLLTKKRAAG